MKNRLILSIINLLTTYAMRLTSIKKFGQVTHIAPLQPLTFAAFPPWRSGRELVVQGSPEAQT